MKALGYVIILCLVTVKTLTAPFTVLAVDYTSQYPTHDASHVKATSRFGDSYYPHFATDPSKSLTGGAPENAWLAGSSSNQRFHIDLGSAKTITRIYIETVLHDYSWYAGMKDFTFWGSNSSTAFDELTYGTDTNWTQLTTDPTFADRHVNTQVSDPQYFTVTNATSYRYYALKIVNINAGDDYMGIRRIELQTTNEEPTPTPSPTPSPTATPTPSPTPTPAPSFDLGYDSGSCVAFYDSISDGTIGGAGNSIYRISNLQRTPIQRVDLYGYFCEQDSPSTCGSGADVFDEYSSFDASVFAVNTEHHYVEVEDLNLGESMAVYTGGYIDYVTCTDSEGTTTHALTPLNHSMNTPVWGNTDSLTGTPSVCQNLKFTVPVIDWSFEFPNWYCLIVKWFGNVFSIDGEVIYNNYEDWKSTLNSKAPFAYIEAINTAIPDIGSPSGISTLADVDYEYNIPMYYNGEWLSKPFLEGTFSFSSYEQFQPEIIEARNAMKVVLWVVALMGIFFTILTL